jgi:hypothetical protein
MPIDVAEGSKHDPLLQTIIHPQLYYELISKFGILGVCLWMLLLLGLEA